MNMWKNGSHPTAYLAGAIEYAPDAGAQWREEIELFLREELHHEVYNPSREERNVLSPDEARYFRSWKSTDLPRFRKVVHRIIDTDLSMLIDKVDYVVCLWDEHVLGGGGTHGELTISFRHGIPVYMVTPIDITRISSWIIGCTTEIFPDFQSLKEFLKISYT